jgi:hypothetical protein
MQLVEQGGLVHRLRAAPPAHSLALGLIDQVLGAIEYLDFLRRIFS